MEFETSLNVNRLVWISSLNANEEGGSRRVIEDLKPYFNSINLSFDIYTPDNADHLVSIIEHLSDTYVAGVGPVIHFDMHSSKKNGLYVVASSQFIPWKTLNSKLQSVNVKTGNNLLAVFASCFAYYMLLHISITEPCPCYIMIAPEKEVTLGFLEDKIFTFYKDVFTKLNAVEAYDRYLSTEMQLFHSEKMLAVVLARYLYVSCVGKAGDERKERLMTEVFRFGRVANVRRNRRSLRKSLDKVVRPDQTLVDRYVKEFLIGKTVSYNIDDLMDFARNIPRKPSRSEFVA